MRQYLNWKTGLSVAALLIVAATLLVTGNLARRVAIEEKKDVTRWADAVKTAYTAPPDKDVTAELRIIQSYNTVPAILTDEAGGVLSTANIDTTDGGAALLQKKLHQFRRENPPITADFGTGKNMVYYGESYLLKQLRYFPYVQLGVILLFLTVVLVALSSAHRAIQNQVWVGLSKETAHQLGTPLSSIEGWLELLADRPENADAVTEMKKDLDRLKLVADRFSKVGSSPRLEAEDLVDRLRGMVNYMQRRAPKAVRIELHAPEEPVQVKLSGPLFDWVVENLIRNALDAMAGKGLISIRIRPPRPGEIAVSVDIQDNGRGMPGHVAKRVFNPGFTTKKRGWGLGLSLSKRIIEQYHRGQLFVRSSEPGKGTTFRIVLDGGRQD